MSFLNRILSSEEEHFIELVHKDIEHFLKCYTIKSVLLFPPLSSFHRLLIHKVAEEYQQLRTFSIGQGQSRRTTVCLQEDLNSCFQKGEALMSLNQPPSARGRGRGRWSSPGSQLENKDQNRLGREDRYKDGPRTEDRHRDGLKSDGRQEQRSARGVDTSPVSQGVPPSRRGRGQNTRTRNKRPDAQIYVPRGRRQQQVPVNQHHTVDDTVLHPCDRDSHNSVMNKRTGNKDHRKGDGWISDIDSKNVDNDSCNKDEFRTENGQNNRCNQGFQGVGRNSTEQTYLPSTKQMSQGRKSRPKLQVYVPPHQKNNNGGQPKEMSGQLHPINCGETKHHVTGDAENVDELRDAEADSTNMTSDHHQGTKVKRAKLNNSPIKLKCEKKMETEQNSAVAFSDIHKEQCRLLNDFSHVPAPNVSDICIPAPNVSDIHIPAPNKSDEHIPGPNVSDIHISAPNVSDIHIPAPNKSDEHVPAPNVSDIHIPASNKSDEHVPAPNVSDIHVPGPNVSDIHIPVPNISDKHVPVPNISDKHVTGPNVSDIHVPGPNVSDIHVLGPDVSDISDQRDSQGDIPYLNDHTSCDLHEVCSSVTNSNTSTNITKVDKETGSDVCLQSNKLLQMAVKCPTSLKRDSQESKTNMINDAELAAEATTAVKFEADHTSMAVIATQEVGEVDINLAENINEKVYQCKKEHSPGLSNEVTMITVDQEREYMDEKIAEAVPNTHCCTDSWPDSSQHMNVDKDFCSGEERKEEEEDEESWDKMFDDEGECLDPVAMEELTSAIGKVKIKKPIIDYLNYKPRDPDLSREDLGHVVEIYDFPPEFKTEDLMSAFQQFKSKGFDIKWVDDTHALGVFNSVMAAQSALSLNHPLLKVRAMSEAARQSKEKAKRCVEFLLPYKARPETSALTARRLVTGALGLAPKVSREQRDLERQKLRQAKEKKKLMKKQKDDIWEGTYTSGNVETS